MSCEPKSFKWVDQLTQASDGFAVWSGLSWEDGITQRSQGSRHSESEVAAIPFQAKRERSQMPAAMMRRETVGTRIRLSKTR